MQDNKTTLISYAVIILGSYHVPAGVAFGALIGSSVFIMSQYEYHPFIKVLLFVFSFLCGIFAGQDIVGILNNVLPFKIFSQVSDFTGAVIASTTTVLLLRNIHKFLDKKSIFERNKP